MYNPIDQIRTGREKENQFFVGRKSRECVYCGEKDHRAETNLVKKSDYASTV